MQKISKYNSSIMAGHKKKEREPKKYLGKIDGKEHYAPSGPPSLIGQGMEQVRIGFNSSDMIAIEAFCEYHKVNRQVAIREAIREYMKSFYDASV